MKFLHNFQNDWKGKDCDHVYTILDESRDFVIKKCIRCFRIYENRVSEY